MKMLPRTQWATHICGSKTALLQRLSAPSLGWLFFPAEIHLRIVYMQVLHVMLELHAVSSPCILFSFMKCCRVLVGVVYLAGYWSSLVISRTIVLASYILVDSAEKKTHGKHGPMKLYAG